MKTSCRAPLARWRSPLHSSCQNRRSRAAAEPTQRRRLSQLSRRHRARGHLGRERQRHLIPSDRGPIALAAKRRARRRRSFALGGIAFSAATVAMSDKRLQVARAEATAPLGLGFSAPAGCGRLPVRGAFQGAAGSQLWLPIALTPAMSNSTRNPARGKGP